MNEFGINLDDLEHKQEPMVVRDLVPGRVVHIDADFLAYQVSYDDEKSVSDMRSNVDVAIEKMRLMAGAEFTALHLTPKGSNKGHRGDIALLKEYQGNRKDKPKPKFLHYIREWMHKERGGILHMNCEADDGMSISQYRAIAAGNKELSVIATKDKDLCMVPGLQLNWDTGEISDTQDDPFGYIELIEMPNKQKTKKVKGRGWKYFWAQMLQGDAADNISGLPKCHTQDFLKTGKPKACGPVLTYEILKDITSNKDAFQVVRTLYKDCGAAEPFKNYRDDSVVPYGRIFLTEAQLLWMRRDESPRDVYDWIIGHCL